MLDFLSATQRKAIAEVATKHNMSLKAYLRKLVVENIADNNPTLESNNVNKTNKQQ